LRRITFKDKVSCGCSPPCQCCMCRLLNVSSHVTYRSCHTWVTSHMSHVTHESRHTWVLNVSSHVNVERVVFYVCKCFMCHLLRVERCFMCHLHVYRSCVIFMCHLHVYSACVMLTCAVVIGVFSFTCVQCHLLGVQTFMCHLRVCRCTEITHKVNHVLQDVFTHMPSVHMKMIHKCVIFYVQRCFMCHLHVYRWHMCKHILKYMIYFMFYLCAVLLRVRMFYVSFLMCTDVLCVMFYVYRCHMCKHILMIYPLTEEIRLQMFGSPDLSVFLIDFLSDGDSVFPRENLFEIVGIPMKTWLICTGTTVKTCWKFWQSQLFSVRFPSSVVYVLYVCRSFTCVDFLCVNTCFHKRSYHMTHFVYVLWVQMSYGVAMSSRLLQIIGLVCRISSLS